MGIFKRPTMADRMDNATERRRPWWATAEIREEIRHANRVSRPMIRRTEDTEPDQGSKAQRSHRRGRS